MWLPSLILYPPAQPLCTPVADEPEYVAQLQDSRLFEPRFLTDEDLQRTVQYQARAQSHSVLASATDMDSYLESLSMEATIREFSEVDAPRLAQLINKSNQFNLTTRRRTQAEVQSLQADNNFLCFCVRLKDRFADHGLISIIIGQINGSELEIDTWLMSCRVLKRQVEDLVLEELVRLAQNRGCSKLIGVYLRTEKNEMVRDFYPQMGFKPGAISEKKGIYSLELKSFRPQNTRIKILCKAYEQI